MGSTNLKDAGVRRTLKKCAFFRNCIVNLPHVIKPGRLKVANHATDAIRKLEVTTTVTERRSFLGLISVFRRFVSNFARIASAISERLKKTEDKELGPFNEEELDPLETVKEKLILPAVFTLPKRNGEYTLDTDACDRQVDCVLLQYQQDGKDRSI